MSEVPEHWVEPDILLSQDQAVRVMAISVMIRDGELTLTGEHAARAQEVLTSVGEEIALQLEGYPESNNEGESG